MSYKKSQNISADKTLIVQIIIVALVIASVLIIEKFFGDKFFFSGEESKKEATLLIDLGDIKRMFEGEVVEKMTILDALNVSVTAGEISLRYVIDDNNNATVTKINDHSAADGKNFSFYINEKNINTRDLNKAFVYPGDKIIVKLE